MTNKEKFYRLAINLCNNSYKTIEIRNNKICVITVPDSMNKLYFECDPKFSRKRLELYVFLHDKVDYIAYEDEPDNIDDLIGYISAHFIQKDELLKGIE